MIRAEHVMVQQVHRPREQTRISNYNVDVRGSVTGGRIVQTTFEGRKFRSHMATIDPPLELVDNYRRKRFQDGMQSPSEIIQGVQCDSLGSQNDCIVIADDGFKTVRLEEK